LPLRVDDQQFVDAGLGEEVADADPRPQTGRARRGSSSSWNPAGGRVLDQRRHPVKPTAAPFNPVWSDRTNDANAGMGTSAI
jgi:hypothetical protein